MPANLQFAAHASRRKSPTPKNKTLLSIPDFKHGEAKLEPQTNLRFYGSKERNSPPPAIYTRDKSSPSPAKFNAIMLKNQEEDNDKDEKAIVKLVKSTLLKFSNETDWEVAMF